MALKERDVVITGMGLITPLGIGMEENWESVKTGKTGIGYYPPRWKFRGSCSTWAR